MNREDLIELMDGYVARGESIPADLYSDLLEAGIYPPCYLDHDELNQLESDQMQADEEQRESDR